MAFARAVAVQMKIEKTRNYRFLFRVSPANVIIVYHATHGQRFKESCSTSCNEINNCHAAALDDDDDGVNKIRSRREGAAAGVTQTELFCSLALA